MWKPRPWSGVYPTWTQDPAGPWSSSHWMPSMRPSAPCPALPSHSAPSKWDRTILCHASPCPAPLRGRGPTASQVAVHSGKVSGDPRGQNQTCVHVLAGMRGAGGRWDSHFRSESRDRPGPWGTHFPRGHSCQSFKGHPLSLNCKARSVVLKVALGPQ